MKNSRIVFQNKESLRTYLSFAILHMRDEKWETSAHFDDLIDEWMEMFHKASKVKYNRGRAGQRRSAGGRRAPAPDAG